MDTDAISRHPHVAELLRLLKVAPPEGLPVFDLPEANRSATVLEACSGAGWIEFGRRTDDPNVRGGWGWRPTKDQPHPPARWEFSVIGRLSRRKPMAQILSEFAAHEQDQQEPRYHIRLTSDGQHLAACLELNEAAAPLESPSDLRRRPGRKKADYETEQKEAAIAADWKRAKASGAYKGRFAKECGMSQKELDKLLTRVRKRQSRRNA